MTGPSSGDRPAEDLMGALRRSVERKGSGHGPAQGSGIKPPTPTSRGSASGPATPPAVRTGDETCWRWPSCDPVIGEDSCTRPKCTTPPPVSGTATRDDGLRQRIEAPCAKTGLDTDVCFGSCCCPPTSQERLRQELARVIAEHRPYRDGPDSLGCTAGCRNVEWEPDHVAGLVLLALGGSQPAAQPKYGYLLDSLRSVGTHAAQPVQPAEEQRPIDLLTEQVDEGLRARVEALADSYWDRADKARDGFWKRHLHLVSNDLRRALDGDGGDRG